jgi:excinuclease ABC subunit A
VTPRLEGKQRHTIEVVVDRLVVEATGRSRLNDSVETALKWGDGRVLILHQAGGSAPGGEWTETLHSTRRYSAATGRSYDTPTPKHFSFNSPLGACEVCHGLGQKSVFDPGLVVPDPEKSLEQGAVAAWRRGGKRMVVYYKSLLKGLTAHYGLSMETPYKNLPEEFRQVLMRGSGETAVAFTFWRAGKSSKVEKPFEGVLPNLDRLYGESESEFTRNWLKAFMTLQPCDACRGRRLKPEILAVTLSGPPGLGMPGDEAAARGGASDAGTVGVEQGRRGVPGWSIMDYCGLSVESADAFLEGLELTPFQRQVASEIIREIRTRLKFLRDVGLEYLTLDRESGTLSGGEAQRIRLATQIGAGLVGVLYILDEPSIGLHARDNDRLLQTLEGLRDLGNTVVVVEHDEETIRRADHVIDLGPGAGVHGGEVIAAGTVAEIEANPRSLTGRYMSGQLSVPRPSRRTERVGEKGWLTVAGARENNLRNIDVRFPLGTLTCVTGVSGSGKSTLVEDILRRQLSRRLYGASERPGMHTAILGIEHLSKMVVVDQAPIGRTPRSNPATYTGVFNHIRDLFARLPAARVRGYEAGRFSFNVRGGRCEKCQGDGMIRIEMNFLPPVYVRCEACGGRRYNRETLEITYKGLNVADVLDLTVDEAVRFFRAVPAIHDPCMTLGEVGLGYLRLGQSATTLSGGEAQRLKLATELNRRGPGHTLYLLDEPTTGLHFHDVATLLDVLIKLRDAGNTLIVIEHNLDVVKCADWIVDLGPEGGSGGGQVVAAGTPEQVAKVEDSHTGRFLRRVLGAEKREDVEVARAGKVQKEDGQGG